MGKAALLTVGAAIVIGTLAASAGAKIPEVPVIPDLYSNCGHLNAKYPHGLGKANAHDVRENGAAPVTNFVRNTALYTLAILYNKRLDLDHDGIACEK